MKETFEDEGFIYELTVLSPQKQETKLHTFSQGEGFCCRWNITGKVSNVVREITVTDDDCEIIVFPTVEAAIRGAKEFLSL